MKTNWSLVLALALGGCGGKPAVEPVPPITFHTMEFKQVDELNPKFRTLFTINERPVLFMAGPAIEGKEMFVELTFNGEGSNISPPLVGTTTGNWFSMGHGDLLPGKYHATLFVAGKPVASEDFRMMK